jgi:hypothetical protein
VGNWSRRQPADGWPVTEGRIESVEATKPSFSFTTKRSYYVAEPGYFYFLAGTSHAGRYKREFPTEHEAEELVRDPKGKPVAVHRNSTSPSSSALLKPDINVLPQNRAPAPAADCTAAANYVPDGIRPFPLGLRPVSGHRSCRQPVGSSGRREGAPRGTTSVLCDAPRWNLRGLVPAVFVAQRPVGNENRKDLWKVVLKDSPDWMRYRVDGFFGYAVVNFAFFMTKAPSGGSGANPPAVVWKRFSGHWMAFYSAALAILMFCCSYRGSKPATFERTRDMVKRGLLHRLRSTGDAS